MWRGWPGSVPFGCRRPWRTRSSRIIVDLDSSESPVHGEGCKPSSRNAPTVS